MKLPGQAHPSDLVSLPELHQDGTESDLKFPILDLFYSVSPLRSLASSFPKATH